MTETPAQSPGPFRPSFDVKTFALLAGFVVIYLSLGFTHLYWGRITGDEGWYSLAARNVADGLVPYRDFQFSQMPLVPYVYGLWFRVAGASVENGRLLSLVFGATGLVFAMLACLRFSGKTAAAICGVLLALNLHYIFDTVTFRTQPLTIALTAAGLFLLARPPSRLPHWIGAMILITLAFFTRLSLLPAMLLLWAYIFWIARGRRFLVSALIGVNAALVGAVFVYFWADGNMLFSIYQTHKEYFGNPPWTLDRLLFHFLKSWANLELLLLFCGVWALFWLAADLLKTGLAAALRDPAIVFRLYLAGSYAGVTLIHVINVQNHATHQTSIIVFLVILSACTLAGRLETCTAPIRKFAMASVVLFALLSAPQQEWSVRFDGGGSVQKIREVCRIIKENARPGDAVLSFNAELAVNSGLKVPRGYEMSEFSYFPMMEDDRREKLNVVNLGKLLEDLSTGRHRIFCAGDREFAIMTGGDPELANQFNAFLSQNYRFVRAVDQYGQFFGTMNVFVRKD